MLVIVPAGEGSEPVYPAALGLDNVLAVEQRAATAPTRRASAAACSAFRARRSPSPQPGRRQRLVLAREPRLDVATLKRRLVEAGGVHRWRARK